jgi:hypothetical protein
MGGWYEGRASATAKRVSIVFLLFQYSVGGLLTSCNSIGPFWQRSRPRPTNYVYTL